MVQEQHRRVDQWTRLWNKSKCIQTFAFNKKQHFGSVGKEVFFEKILMLGQASIHAEENAES